MRSPARPTRGAFALVASVAVVSACSAGDGADSSAASSTVQAPDLASGLLPADAFGPDAAVTAITPEELRQGAGAVAAGAADVQITPPQCVAAVAGTQPNFDAAQSSTTGTAATVEVLARGGPTEDTVDLLQAAAVRCPQAQLTAPGAGQSTVTFESVPVDDLVDGAALLRYTTVLSLPDGTQATVPALIGAVEDGNRLLILLTIESADLGGATGAPVDPAAFAALLARAYEAQAQALD
jgi:hypothetical protein